MVCYAWYCWVTGEITKPPHLVFVMSHQLNPWVADCANVLTKLTTAICSNLFFRCIEIITTDTDSKKGKEPRNQVPRNVTVSEEGLVGFPA